MAPLCEGEGQLRFLAGHGRYDDEIKKRSFADGLLHRVAFSLNVSLGDDVVGIVSTMPTIPSSSTVPSALLKTDS